MVKVSEKELKLIEDLKTFKSSSCQYIDAMRDGISCAKDLSSGEPSKELSLITKSLEELSALISSIRFSVSSDSDNITSVSWELGGKTRCISNNALTREALVFALDSVSREIAQKTAPLNTLLNNGCYFLVRLDKNIYEIISNYLGIHFWFYHGSLLINKERPNFFILIIWFMYTFMI